MITHGKSSGILAAAILCLINISIFPQEIRYFRSDSAGNLYDELLKKEIPAKEYWASTEVLGNLEIRKTFKNQELISETRSEFSDTGILIKKTEFIDGTISSELVFNSDETLFAEREFLPGGTIVEIFYKYRNKKLIEKEIIDGEGVKSIIAYLYGFDGRLLEVRESGVSSSGASANSANETSDWIKSSDGFIVTKYNSSGKPSKTERFVGQKIQSIQESKYENDRLATQKTSFPDTLTAIEAAFNAEGLKETEKIYIKNKLSEDSRFEYYEDGSPKSRVTKKNGITELTEYSKETDTGAEIEKHFINGQLSTLIHRKSNEDYFIEIYDFGMLAVTTFFQDGRKTKEQFWKNGVIIKERIFP